MPHVTLTVYFILTAVNWAHWLWIHHLFLWCTVKTSVGTFLSWWSSSGSHEVICGDSDFLAACVRCDCCLLSSLLGGFHMWHVHNRQYHLLISQSVAQAHGRNSIWGGGRFTAFQDTVRFQPHVTSQGAQSNEFTSWQPFFISSRTQLCLKQRCRRYKQMTAAETTREQEERDKVWQEEGPQVFYRCSSSSSSRECSLMGHFSLTSLWDRNKHKYLSKCLSNIHI